jgi:HK97 family phage major capsid protein
MADITRADAQALLKEASVGDIIQEATQASAALSTFRTIRMSAKQHRMPVLAALPNVGFVGESATEKEGVKPTTEVNWENKFLTAEELAVIVPIHENVIADQDFDIWGEVRPLVAEAFGRKLDEAVFYGTDKPATWTDPAIVPGAIALGNTVAAGAGQDLGADFNEAFGLVEDNGFDVTDAYAGRNLRSQLRAIRDANGSPIYLDGIRSDNNTSSIYGQPLYWVRNGAWDRSKALAVVGDSNYAVLGIRSDMEVKFLDQATVGGINLAERDMIALRFKFRVGFATATPKFTREGGENPYPFAVITPKAADGGESGK